MFLVVFISAITGIVVGACGCYLWREADIQRQLRQVLNVMETDREREDISLPIASQLRRRAIASQQLQQNLEQQLFGWQSVLQEAPIGYIKLDAENQILWCNQMAKELLHIQKWEPSRARLLLELVRSYELDRSIQKVRSSQTAQSLIWQFYYGYQDTAEAQSIWLKSSSIPLLDGAIGVFIESQQAQVEAKTERERWLTDLAHEIRTPLTAIRLVAETLQAKVTPDLNRWVEQMLQETNRLIDLVQHFLELSQLETAPTQYLKLADVDIIELIEDAWYTLEPIASQKQIKFTYPESQKITLEIDRARFIQVFINLFDNSIKYCPERGQIRIEVRQTVGGASPVEKRAKLGKWLEIDFYDDGGGFAPTDLPYIFDRLYRGDPSRNRHSISKNTSNVAASEKAISTTGSGLGLAIVRQIILAHGGTISATNHPQTGGAWLQIVLPNPA